MLGSLFSSGSGAIRSAARAEQRGIQRGIQEQRRQFDETRDLLTPFIDAGAGSLGLLEQGATFPGFASLLSQIMESPELDPIRQGRMDAINTQFGSMGLLNSGARGRAIADDLTDFTLGIESLLSGRQAGLAGMGLQGATGLAGFGQQTANNISGMEQGFGQSRAAGILSQQQARTARNNQLLGLAGGAGGGALMGSAGMLGSLGAGGGAALGLLMSDGRLKQNLIPRGKLGPLTVYDWEWIPEVQALGLASEMTTGFIAEEVAEHYPHHVHKVGPFNAVDYHSLLDEIEGSLQ